MADKPYRGHRADLVTYDDYAGPLMEELNNYPPKLFLTREEIEYFVKAGYPANMFVCLPEQVIVKEEEDVNKESN